MAKRYSVHVSGWHETNGEVTCTPTHYVLPTNHILHAHTHTQVKKDIDTGKSRGFGFVRYFDEDIQKKVQGMKHTVKGRKVDVKFPKKVNLHSFKADFSATLSWHFPRPLIENFDWWLWLQSRILLRMDVMTSRSNFECNRPSN